MGEQFYCSPHANCNSKREGQNERVRKEVRRDESLQKT